MRDTYEVLESFLNENALEESKQLEFLRKQQWYFVKFQTFCQIKKPDKKELTKYYDPYYVLAEVKTRI